MINKITYEDFQKLEEVRERLMQLDVMRKYLSNVFKYKPFCVEVSIKSGMGHEVISPFEHRLSPYDTFGDSEDAKYIIDCIDKRIAELKSEVFAENLSPDNIPSQ